MQGAIKQSKRVESSTDSGPLHIHVPAVDEVAMEAIARSIAIRKDVVASITRVDTVDRIQDFEKEVHQ